MAVSSKKQDDQLVITVSGKFNYADMVDFSKSYHGTAKGTDATVDLTQTTHIDSSSLGMLIAFRSYLGDSANITLLVARDSIRKILDTARFDKKFQIKQIGADD